MYRHALSLALVAVTASVTTLGVQELTRTFVVNLKDPHPIEGSVRVPEPIPHGQLVTLSEVVVAPATRAQTGLWTDAGTLDARGFTRVVLSLHGQLRGSTAGGGAVVLVLVPEQENVQQALVEGEVHLSLEARADPVSGEALYFSGSSDSLALGFPAYRVFLYDTTDRSASVDVYAYLSQ